MILEYNKLSRDNNQALQEHKMKLNLNKLFVNKKRAPLCTCADRTVPHFKILFKGRALALNGLSSENSKENHPCEAYVFICQGYSHNTSMDCRPTFCVNSVSRCVSQCHHQSFVCFVCAILSRYVMCPNTCSNWATLLFRSYISQIFKFTLKESYCKHIGFISYSDARFLISKPLPFSSRSCKAKFIY
jgi:hypothetical protein